MQMDNGIALKEDIFNWNCFEQYCSECNSNNTRYNMGLSNGG